MSKSDFVHLHVHTQYSLLDGACRIPKLVAKAAEYEMPALAMTDHGNMFGTIEFYQACQKANIKPIIGCEAYVTINGSHTEKTPRNKFSSHLLLLAKNETGYKNLMKLTSIGYLDGFYYNPRVDKDLLAQHSEGLICSSACLKGEVAWNLGQDNYNAALKAADELKQIFGRDNFYLEMMDHGIELQHKVNPGIVKLSKEIKVPLIATNDVHYLTQDQSTAHEALLCIQTQTTLDDPRRMRLSTDQFYFKSAEEMARVFDWSPEAIANTREVADKCNLKFDFDKFHLPEFYPPKGKTKDVYLRELCEKGIKERYGKETEEVRARLERELEVIDSMGFNAYFLIVWDFIQFAKSKKIPVGPGRGSAAGSIVSYLIGITDLDPLKYDLLFERFLNPDRAGMPDIDIDFCFERRGEVIEYVNKKYGESNVAQIITFGTMQAKAAIRDVGRVMGASYGEVDAIAKLVPNELGITLEEALEKEPKLEKLTKDDKQAGDIVHMAQTLEGLTRHASIHAAGVVISDKELTEYCPLFKTSDDQVTTAFAMNSIAKIGLLKMDFLGLRTLTVISDAVRLIKNRHGVELDMGAISLKDEKAYHMLGLAQSFGVFQLESPGMRDLLKKLKPAEFEDLIAILALYRPGPMGSGMLDDYIKRRRGEQEIKYDHPVLEPILKETYGIILYQEQVMKIPVVLAGFSLVQADHLRRAMSKKIVSVMQKMREDFVNGCQKTSHVSPEKANYIFDLIDYFSGYGFNKSHSAAYALISYQTAYLKANYPVEFMTALLNSEKNNTDKIVEYVKESEAMGIAVVPPNVNRCFREFTVDSDKTILYGLQAVKNVGGSAIDSIVQNRESGYVSLNDLAERVDLRLANKKVFESLIKCGALDEFGALRSQMMAVVERILEGGARTQKEKASGQVSFFDMGGDDVGFTKENQAMPDIKEWRETQKLSYEKEMLGLYVSGHPLSHYQVEIKEFTDFSTTTLARAIEGEEVRLVGIINKVKLTNTRKTGERMAIIRIEDTEGEVEVVVFPSTYSTVGDQIVEGEVVFVKGKASTRDEEVKIIAGDINRIQNVYRAIKAINVDLSSVGEPGIKDLKSKLTCSPGATPVYLTLNTEANKSVEILVGEDLFVTPNEELMNEIKDLVGDECFSVTL